MADKNKLYQDLYAAVKFKYRQKSGKELQDLTNEIWLNAKRNKESLVSVVDSKIKELCHGQTQTRGTLHQFFNQQFTQPTRSVSSSVPSNASSSVPSNASSAVPSTASSSVDSNVSVRIDLTSIPEPNETDSETSSPEEQQPRPKPAQELLSKKIAVNNAQLNALYQTRAVGLNTSVHDKQIKSLASSKRKLETELEALERDRKRKKLERDRRNQALQKITEKFPETKSLLQLKETVGRPRIETEQPGLLQAIVDIASYGSSTDERRRSEMLNFCSSLGELQSKLHEQGYNIKRSALYLRLLPRNSLTNEGKRHVTTVPVKLTKAQNSLHKDHVDGRFCQVTNKFMEELASLLGPESVIYLSQDDKARVPIGITAAHKQTTFLMHVEYRVSLPDHDFVKGGRHKLIPSVIAGIEIKPGGAGQASDVTYSGPTYVSIRSGKHDTSNAATHAFDFERVIDLPEFEYLIKHNGVVKPVLIKNCDGGPDENPRYSKVIRTAIHHFVKYDLDAYYIVTNAPGRSAFNRVERRMAPLSKELAGVVLPHDTFGTHLDKSGNTVDSELEKKNFASAGEILAEIWSGITLDSKPVVAEYIEPGKGTLSHEDMIERSPKWLATHCRVSQYFLQIFKCDDHSCCKPFRSSIKSIIQDRFIKAPLRLEKKDSQLIVSKDGTTFGSLFLNELLHKEITAMPFDEYCCSVSEKLATRTCKICKFYCASMELLKQHGKVHKQSVEIKVRPERVAAKRAKELLVMMNKENDYEWIDEELVESPAPLEEKLSFEKLQEKPLSSYLQNNWDEIN